MKPRNNVVIEKNNTCSKCNLQFTRHDNLKRHRVRCQVDLSKPPSPEDFAELMRKRNFNFSDINAINSFNRFKRGQRAAAPNLARNLRQAVENLEEFFTTETLKFKRNVRKKGKLIRHCSLQDLSIYWLNTVQ